MKKIYLWLALLVFLPCVCFAGDIERAGGGSGTDDQTASEVSVTTSAFGGLFANDASHDNVQELFDILDDADYGGGGSGYIALPAPHSGGSGLAATPDTDFTNATRGQVEFSNSVADTTNYVEYRIAIPTDMDTAADVILESFFVVAASAGTNTSKQRYYISMDVVASDAAYSGTVARPATINLTETASTATGDVLGIAAPVTLIDWKTDLASHEGEIWVIRVARDGDDATNDSSVIETFSGPITLKYTKE